MGYTWAGNSKRVNIHAHARLCTHACAFMHTRMRIYAHTRPRSMPRSRWWKSKASSWKLKWGFLSGALVESGKTFPRFSNDVNPEFSSVNRSLARRNLNRHQRLLPVHLLCPSMKSKLAWWKIDGGIRLDTEIPFPRSRYFVIGGIEFSNGSRSVIWKGGRFNRRNERKISAILFFYSLSISKGRDSFNYACWSFFRSSRRSIEKTRSSTFSEKVSRKYFCSFY